MVKAIVWIGGVQYTGDGKDRNSAYDDLNKKWQRHCDNDTNSDRRQLSKFAEHIKYTNG
jgi:hypothetical protein